MSNLTHQQSPEALTLLDEKILAMVLGQASLPETLQVLCEEIEKHYRDLLCSVLLLDSDAVTLRHGASPSLPKEYSQAIDGTQIGPCQGSCGTAAYRRQPVIVSDIATDKLWEKFRHLALPHGLRACWSTPINSREDKILGTFAIYYREPRTPDAQHLRLIAHATHLARIAIESDRDKADLRLAETRYRTLVERLPAITYIAEMGVSGRWHYVSPQIESILGFSPQEWLADPMNWTNHICAEDRETALAAERRFQETHEFMQVEYRMMARDGRVLWFRDEAITLQEIDPHRFLMQGLMYDITEHKRLEDQLRQAQKMEAMGQMAGGVAHDFNNLLMLIQAHNERLRVRLSPSDPGRKDSLQIDKIVARAAVLTRQLLAFSRKQVLQVRVLDLNEVVTEVAKILGRVIGTSITLKIDLSSSPCLIKADPGQMEQVIVNLAMNARDAMPDGGRLTIETRHIEINPADPRRWDGVSPGRYVVLVVVDTGVGMSREIQARMFEPFFTTKDPGKGTGLGLSTVYGVVKQTGGWTHVKSEPGQGTTFEICLPAATERDERSSLRDKGKEAELVPTGTETVLVVEDEDGIREVACEFLQSLGYKALDAVDGAEALRIAEGHEDLIHLLVTDIVMPKMGGRELESRLKQVRPQLKVLFMSGYPEHPSLSSDSAGQNAVLLEKPFSRETLGRMVRKVLDQE